jgi:hypothetical protein
VRMDPRAARQGSGSYQTLPEQGHGWLSRWSRFALCANPWCDWAEHVWVTGSRRSRAKRALMLGVFASAVGERSGAFSIAAVVGGKGADVKRSAPRAVVRLAWVSMDVLSVRWSGNSGAGFADRLAHRSPPAAIPIHVW